jgi:plasmid maintenance system antidote protein VapI
MTPQFWLNLQTEYDIRVALRDAGNALKKIERVNEAA